MLTRDVARTHDLIHLREPITLTVDTSRLVASGFDLTVWNPAAQSYGLGVGLIWWSIASAPFSAGIGRLPAGIRP